MDSITESQGKYTQLDTMNIRELLIGINSEDQTVPLAIRKAIPQIEKLVSAIVEKMRLGGRLFYIGAGTSGRLGIVDASECPPTFGVPFDLVVGIIAGGDGAIRRAVEFAEDDQKQAWEDLKNADINVNDFVIGIAASGRTPYVVGGLEACKANNIATGAISCNPGATISKAAQYPVEVITGPEFVTGSTRMKAGTAQKLILNMISTTVMIELGKVKGSKMVDMQLSNHKLIERGVKMLVDELKIETEIAQKLLKQYGNVRNAIKNFIAK